MITNLKTIDHILKKKSIHCEDPVVVMVMTCTVVMVMSFLKMKLYLSNPCVEDNRHPRITHTPYFLYVPHIFLKNLSEFFTKNIMCHI